MQPFDAYTAVPRLNNPGNDARDLAVRLRSLGFKVGKAFDLDERGMRRRLQTFNSSAAGAEVALVFFAEHGIIARIQRILRLTFPRGAGAQAPCHWTRKGGIFGVWSIEMAVLVLDKRKKPLIGQGRVAIRVTGRFNIQTRQGVVQGISHRHCRLLQRADGYGYTFHPKPIQEDASRAG